MRTVNRVAAMSLGILAGLAPASAQTLTKELVTGGLARPVFVTHAPDDYGRIFIVEQFSGTTGRVRIFDLKTNTLLATPFLSVSPVTTGNEQGLLGLAFHPKYADNGFFYVNYTTSGGGAAGRTIVARYQVSPTNPNVADPGSAMPVIIVNQPFSNHNGGWTEFGPDGYLYIALGDGGSAGDPGNRAQNKLELLGKMLRIDVDGDDFPADPNANYRIPPTNPFYGMTSARQEIWAVGLRNPWRDCFDRATGDLYIADVGQNQWEEINFQPGNSPGGENYGWKCYEGNVLFSAGICNDPNALKYPFLVYGHSQIVPPTNATGCSVTGGVVYRGCNMPELGGTYFFGDFCSNKIFSLRYDGSTITDFVDRSAQLSGINGVSSFGVDALGEMYVCALNSGQVWRVTSAAPVTPDCNSNGRKDDCDILGGFSNDVNQNGTPDDCECVGDLDGDKATGQSDLGVLLAAYDTCEGDPGYNAAADINKDKCVNQADLGILLADYGCQK